MRCYLCERSNVDEIGLHPDFNVLIFGCSYCDFSFCDSSSLDIHGYYEHEYRANAKLSETYHRFMLKRAESQIEYVTRFIPVSSSTSVLDIGPGIGVTLSRLRERFASTVCAVEYDKAMINILESNGIRMAGLPSLDRGGEKFDLIILSHVLEHLPDPLDYLNQLRSILSMGGSFFIEVPNQPRCYVERIIEDRTLGTGHLFFFTPCSFKILLSKIQHNAVKDVSTYGVSIDQYILNFSTGNNFDLNPLGDGIFMRCLSTAQ